MPFFADFEMTKMIGYGMPGVWTHAFVDMWSPGYLGFMSSNHNGMLRMYETFGNGGANTMRRTIGGGRRPRRRRWSAGSSSPGGPSHGHRWRGAGGRGGRGGRGGAAAPDTASAALAGGGGNMTARDWYRPLPPPRTLTWTMRNNTNYMETGVLSALELTASVSKTVLENFYIKSRNSVDSGSKDAPYGYVFPVQPEGSDARRVRRQRSAHAGHRSRRGHRRNQNRRGTYPAGSLVVKRNQPYGRLAKILLEKQDYPHRALTTYDDTAWTMGLMSHAKVDEITDKAILNVPVKNLAGMYNPAGRSQGQRRRHRHSAQRLEQSGDAPLSPQGRQVRRARSARQGRRFDLPAGTFLVASSPRVKAEVEKLGLQAVALAAAPEGKKHAVDIPRVAMFSTWGTTQDVGWVRYAFDKFEINYDLIYKDRIRQGNLRAAYDVIVIPSQGGRGGAPRASSSISSRSPARPSPTRRTPNSRRSACMARATTSRAAWDSPVSANSISSSTRAAS